MFEGLFHWSLLDIHLGYFQFFIFISIAAFIGGVLTSFWGFASRPLGSFLQVALLGLADC